MKLVIAFTIGALISGICTFNFLHNSHEKSIELIYHGFYAADLERSTLLMTKEDTELKCFIASLAVYDAGSLRNVTVEDSFIYDAPGLPAVTRESIDEALDAYNIQQVKRYADECKTKST